MMVAGVRRVARVSPPLNTNPSISTFAADVLTVLGDNVAVATFTVTAKDNTGTVLVGATVVPSCTNSANSTFSTPAVTDSTGQTSFTLKASAAATRVVTITINGIPVTGSVSIVFTAAGQTIDRTKSTVSLQAASANAGDSAVLVTLQGVDTTGVNMATGGATVVFGHSGGSSVISISATTDVGNGTYTALITPTTAGTATTLSATIGGLSVTTTMPTFTVTSASYTAGDILDNFGFENTWLVGGKQAFTNNASTPSAASPATLAFSTTQTYAGTYAMKRYCPVTTTENSAQVWCMYGRPDTSPWLSPTNPYNQNGNTGGYRLYSRFWMYLDAAFDGILKLQINENYGATNDQAGGWYLQDGYLTWTFACNSPSFIRNVKLATVASLVGGWHSFESDYWIGTGTPTGNYSARLWIDNAEVTSAISLNGCVFTGGRLDANTPGNNSTMGSWGLCGIQNGGQPLPNGHGNTVATNIYIDRVSLSTLGRVGP